MDSFYQTRKPQLLRLSNILLRVPSIFILELLYNSGTRRIIKEGDVLGHRPSQVIVEWGLNPENVTIGVQYVGYVVAFLLHALPISRLLELYRHIMVGLLLVASHTLSAHFISRELYGPDPESPICKERDVPRTLAFLTAQAAIALLCGALMRTRHLWAFGAYLVPVLFRLLDASDEVIETSHIAAESFVLAETTLFILTHILVPYRLALNGLHMMQSYVELYGIVSVAFAVYNRFFIPMAYLIFWCSMFIYHLFTYFFSQGHHAAFEDKWVLLLLTTIADCCASPWSLIGLCFSVSYGAYTVLTFCRVYLKGFHRQGDTDAGGYSFLRQGWTEGIMLLLLALQTGLLRLRTHEKVLLLGVVLFIVTSATIQSVYELTDPVLLSLGVSNRRDPLLHARVLAMCSMLFLAPLYMSYELAAYFRLEFWLAIVVSSCLLTSVQTAASVMVYLLFMLDHRRRVPSESLDDIVYAIHAVCHLAEFAIAIFVLLYGAWEGLNGEYNLMGTSIIAMHSYFNVWQRGQKGWNSFLLRMNASKQVKSLPEANLNDLQDVCAICYEEMKSARVTPCRHFFHTVCLRKWLYVQTTCPMCHSAIVSCQQDADKEGNVSGDGDRNMDTSTEREVGSEDYYDAESCVCDGCR